MVLGKDTGEQLSTVRDRIQSANVYLGAWPMVEALNQGAEDMCIPWKADDALRSVLRERARRAAA